MSEANFSLIFEGPSVDNGEMDIRDLAPSLLAVGELIQSANSQINENRARIAVKLRATGKGSVAVHLTMVQSFAEQAIAMFDSLAEHKDGISAAKDLAEIIFGVSGGFFALLKWLKGRKPDKVEVKGGDTYIHIGDTYIITNSRAVELAENVEAREQARKLVSVLQGSGIETISTYSPTGEKLSIKKDDVPSFDIPDVEEETLDESEREMFLQIDSLSFREGNKWRMTDGGEPFFAILEDVDFLNRIGKGEAFFSKNDFLHCLVKEKQVRTAKGALKKERKIIRVLEHRQGARQLKLL